MGLYLRCVHLLFKKLWQIGLFTHSWAIWLSAPELVWELNWELNCSSISGSIGTQLWLPWSRIFGFGSGSAALAPWEPFHYINPPNFFVCIFHVSDNFKKYIFLRNFLSLWDDKDRQALFAFLQPMCGSRSQSWKWELKAENSAPIELVPGAVY